MENIDASQREEKYRKLGELIHDIHFAMLTTLDSNQVLKSRPMATQQTEFDGTLWFFTRWNSAKVEEIEADRHVNVAYSDPDDHIYVSASGTAQIVRDRKKMEELWNPFHKAWFPKGLDDPEIALIRVDVQQAEYWDSHAGSMVPILGAVKAMLTGRQAKPGENEKIELDRDQTA